MQTNTAIIVAIISACAGALLGWSLASKSTSDSSSDLTGLTFIKQAICTFNANDKVTGSLEFTQSENDPWVDVRGKLTGSEVPDGNHGFHVHVAGNLGDGCKAAKGHYNPMSLDHGSPQAERAPQWRPGQHWLHQWSGQRHHQGPSPESQRTNEHHWSLHCGPPAGRRHGPDQWERLKDHRISWSAAGLLCHWTQLADCAN
ncbi:Superoxide dismutase [Halotydeus destructor]|nr:Superoxide dismutase [Halotydeus destructor]